MKTLLELIDDADIKNQELGDIIQEMKGVSCPEIPDSDYVRPLPKEWEDWLLPPTNTSNITYVSTSGDDSNPGTQELPIKTVGKAIEVFGSMSVGDAVLFKRGDTFEYSGHYDTANEKFVVRWYKSRIAEVGGGYRLMGAYGEGDRPIIQMVTDVGFLAFEAVRGLYFKDLHIIGTGYNTDRGSGFMIWDAVQYIVFNNVRTDQFRVGVKLGHGRRSPGFLNTHHAMLNCQGDWNRLGYQFGGCVSNLWIDGCVAKHNGANGGAHHYYLEGYLPEGEDVPASGNYVFQRNKGFDSEGGAAFVAHGRIDGFYMVNNHFEQTVESLTNNGRWGTGIDDGRNIAWGVENFKDLVYTGNFVKYCGNLNMSFTNCDGALIGWNTTVTGQNGTGLKAPSKANPDVASKIKTLTVVHNKAIIEGNGQYSIGFSINIEDLTLEYNEVEYKKAGSIPYLINGERLIDLGTNKETLTV